MTLHTRITILSDVCQSAGYPQGRSVNAFLQALTGASVAQLVPDLGGVHRICIWEKLALESKLSERGIKYSEESPQQPLSQAPPSELGLLVSGGDPALPSGEATSATNGPTQTSLSRPAAPAKNAKALTHYARHLTSTLNKFFQGQNCDIFRIALLMLGSALVKMFMLSRRNPDSAQRKQALETGGVVADVLLLHLKWNADSELFN
jgi:E3 ubiquitin-protein ligase HUWE1